MAVLHGPAWVTQKDAKETLSSFLDEEADVVATGDPPSFWAQEHWGHPPRPVVCNCYPWGAPAPDWWVHREMDVLLEAPFLP